MLKRNCKITRYIRSVEDYNNKYAYSDMNVSFPKVYKIINFVDYDTIIDILKNSLMDYSESGISTNITGTERLCNFIEKNHKSKYIFQNLLDNNRSRFNMIKHLIPCIMEDNLRMSRFYMGKQYTGSHIHNHSFAINYLIKGMKVWFMFPNTKHNIKFLKDNKFNYGNIKENPLEWLLKNEDLLRKNIEQLHVRIQKAGELFVVPTYYYHGVYNLEDCCGVTYSWY